MPINDNEVGIELPSLEGGSETSGREVFFRTFTFIGTIANNHKKIK